jgi:hypothetical protein
LSGWKNTTIWVGLAIIVALFVPAVALVSRQAFFQVIDAVIFAGAFALCVGHAFATWGAIRLPIRRIGLGQLLAVGMFVVCFSLAVAFGNLWAWRVLHKPVWLGDSIPAAFSRWMLAAGLFAAVAVVFTSGGSVTIGSYRRSAVLLAGAAFLAIVLIWMGLG